MNMYETIALAIVILAVVVYRQLRTRPVMNQRVFVMPLILAALGVFSTVSYLGKGGGLQSGHVVAVVTGLVLSAVLAYPRARSMKIWRDGDGTWLGRGTGLTLVWWLVTVGVHIGVSLLVPPLFGEHGTVTGGLESATIGLFVAVTLGVQVLVRWHRVARLSSGETHRVRQPV